MTRRFSQSESYVVALIVLVPAISWLPQTAQANPSFDCNKASTQVENLICEDARLAQLDSELAEAYKVALRDSPWASANRRIRREQEIWLVRRDRCADANCLRHQYHNRIGALYAEVSGGDTGSGAGTRQPPTGDPGSMMASCRDRAAHVFHVRLPSVDTKFEGQRVDGTYAVNGTAYLRGYEETFQCSFAADGRTIDQFIVN